MKPYTDINIGSHKIRTFLPDVESSELVWHRDHNHRIVTVLEGNGWHIQMDNCLPVEMKANDVYEIPKETYHRLYKTGRDILKIKIEEPFLV